MRQVDVTGDAVAPERLQLLVAKAFETYTAVQAAAQSQPNFSDFHVHAAVELSDGRWASAPNVEFSREITLCAERTAIFTADGPRGPIYQTKMGPIRLAAMTGAPIGMNSRSWVKMILSFNGRLRALAPMVPLPQSRPSSQILAGWELTNPRSGTGRGAELAG